MLIRYLCLWAPVVKTRIKSFFTKEDGAVDIVAVVILLAIAVALAVLFRKQISTLVTNLWTNINTSAEGLGGEIGG